MANEAKIKELVKKRASIKAKLTQFISFLANAKSYEHLSDTQLLELELRIRKLESSYSAYDEFQSELEIISDTPEELYADREQFESQYYSQIAAARNLIAVTRKLSQQSDSASEVGSGDNPTLVVQNNRQNNVRLPKINLPHFSGGYQDWLEFKDIYVSLIHNEKGIDEINKFHYLRTSLHGSAALIIRSLDFTAENYRNAWSLLCERYDNKQLLVNNHVKSLFSINSIQRESSHGIRNIVDVTNKNLRALQTLKQPVEHWDTLIIFIMASKLDSVTSRHWEEHRNTLTDTPRLDAFIQFLRNRANLLETLEESRSNKEVNNSNNKQKSFVVVPNNNNSNLNKMQSYVCPLCKNNHFIFNCDTFKALPVKSRILKAKECKVCLNCLRPGHSYTKCKLGHCKYCKTKHNTLLHSNDDAPTLEHVALSANNDSSRHVLLSTALVKVLGADGKEQHARVLLDNGSTANFVTQSLTVEEILDAHTGGDYPVPPKYGLQKPMIIDQLQVIVEKQLYTPKNNVDSSKSSSTQSNSSENNTENTKISSNLSLNKDTPSSSVNKTLNVPKEDSKRSTKVEVRVEETSKSDKSKSPRMDITKNKDTDYRPIVNPTRRVEDFLNVVLPKGKMAAKHASSAPYHIFYTTITSCRDTHKQPYSITFQEILDRSLGELKCSLQINFMVELGWLLAQYYFAGYSEKKLTILYGEESPDLKTINKKKPHVDAHHVSMATPFGKHHTKMMILCYEDGSLRVVVSTANLYLDDWENRTQGLWFSPSCPELPPDAMPHDGDSPTLFKRSLLRYLNHYHMPQLSYYVERVKRCDFSHINVFLVASAPGSHFDMDWSLTRMGSLLRQHCSIPPEEQRTWPLIAQASSLGSYGKEPKLWLTGDFLHNFIKIKNQSQLLSSPPELKLIYPSLENVKQSHDDLLGGGCLPYAAEAHAKQPWLNNFLYQWKATWSRRDRAMPHIKSYTRVSPDNKMAAFYLLTSANVSKAAWGSVNKGNAALRVMSYEAGVLLLPRFVINEDFFQLEGRNKLIIPYDIPPTKYTPEMSPWVQDYLF